MTGDDERVDVPHAVGTFSTVRRRGSTNRVHIELPTTLTTEPLPDQPNTVHFPVRPSPSMS